jgi:hypothetical protein
MNLDELRSRATEVQHGFAPLVALAKQIAAAENALDLAERLWESPEHQCRMLGVIVWGDLSPRHPELLARIREAAIADADWRVQEIVARSLTAWCTANGWEASVATLEEWLADDHATVRRAATEGPRVWTRRPYFREHPEVAVRMLRAQLDDPDDYARRSAENALRDVLKRHPEFA